jgi:hypothetical protein
VTPAASLFSHLTAMTDDVGLFEHARFDVPRPEHGYCVDDVARGLVAVCRAMSTSPADGPVAGVEVVDLRIDTPALARLARVYLAFVASAQSADGAVVNRRGSDGAHMGPPTVEDCWGRALWALGTAAARAPDLAQEASALFARGAARRSPWLRAMAFAGLGAAEMLRVEPGCGDARALLGGAADAVASACPHDRWWPEERLTYANAVLPDVLMAAGDTLDRDDLTQRGLAMLDRLLRLQLRDGHLSLVPATGWAAGEMLPAFDQQPIEAATLADACARAFDLTLDTRWADAVHLCAGWFLGANDVGVPLYDPATGGCCDGLEAHGRNENQGAESTLALVTTIQHASRLAPRRPQPARSRA